VAFDADHDKGLRLENLANSFGAVAAEIDIGPGLDFVTSGQLQKTSLSEFDGNRRTPQRQGVGNNLRKMDVQPGIETTGQACRQVQNPRGVLQLAQHHIEF